MRPPLPVISDLECLRLRKREVRVVGLPIAGPDGQRGADSGAVAFSHLFPLGIAISPEFIGQFEHLESSWLTCSGGWGRTMSDFARRRIEPSGAFRPVSAGL